MKNLSIRELKFIEEYLSNGFSGAKSYKIAYGCKNSNVAKAEAWTLLKKPKIQSAIEASERSYRQMAREMQMGRKNILKELIKIIKSDDPKDKLAGINTLGKLCGDFAPQKKEISFEYESSLNKDLTKLSDEELLILRDEILADL
jgi:hypothetical protein